MTHIEIVQLLVNHLPNSNYYDDPAWDLAWDELSDEAQESVADVHRAAWEFISKHQLDKLVGPERG